MRRAQGFAPIKQFQHHGKVRRNAQRINNLQSDQGLEMTSWGHVAAVKHKVDVGRVNWQGYIVYSAINFDPTPRLRRG